LLIPEPAIGFTFHPRMKPLQPTQSEASAPFWIFRWNSAATTEKDSERRNGGNDAFEYKEKTEEET
jgi:hypothetical protein